MEPITLKPNKEALEEQKENLKDRIIIETIHQNEPKEDDMNDNS